MVVRAAGDFSPAAPFQTAADGSQRTVGPRMLEMTGKRLCWTGLLCLGMGLPLLFTLALAGLGVSLRVAAEPVQDVGDRSPAAGSVRPPSTVDRRAPTRAPAAGEWAADTSATIKLTAWRAFIDGSTPEFSALGAVPAAKPLAGAAVAMPRPWTVSPAAAAVPPCFYRPQAPPSRA